MLNNVPQKGLGQAVLLQKKYLLQGLATILTTLTIAAFLLISLAPIAPLSLGLVIVSLAVLLITVYLAQNHKTRPAIHFFFAAQVIVHSAHLYGSGLPHLAYPSFAYFMLIALVAVALLDSMGASVFYATAVLGVATYISQNTGQIPRSYLISYALTVASLGAIIWFANIYIKKALRPAQDKAGKGEQAHPSTEISSHHLQKSAEIGQVINSIIDLKQLLSTAANLITDQFGYYFVGIYLLDDPQNQLILRGCTNAYSQKLLERAFSLNLQENAIICWAANHREGRIAENVNNDPAYLSVPELPETQSELALPLLVHDKLLGVLDVQSKQPGAFQKEDIAFLQILANQIAGNIETALTFAQTEAQLHEIGALYNLNSLLTTTLDVQEIYRRGMLSFAEMLPIARGSLYTWDSENHILTSHIDIWSRKGDEGAPSYTLERRRVELVGLTNTQRVLQTLEPIIYFRGDPNLSESRQKYLEDAGMDTCLHVPLVQGVEAVGLIELFRTAEQGKFHQHEIHLAQAMATQVGSARQNAVLATEARARAAQFSTLNRISTLVSLSPTLADVFEGARREIFALSQVTGLSIMLLTPDKTHINWIYGFEKGQEVDLTSIPPLSINQGFSGYVARTREILHINRHMQEKSAEFQSMTVGALPSSWLGLPLIVANELIGVLAVENEYDNDAFTEQDVALLKVIVGPLAIAINNLLQFNRVEAALESQSKQRVQLQTAAEVAAAATSILDRQELMERSVNLIKERFALYYVGLFLAEEGGTVAVLHAGSGEAGRVQVAQGHRLEIGGRSLIGGAMSDGRVRITQDVKTDEEWRPNPILPDTQAELALPLKVRDMTIGALTVQSTQPNTFEDSLIRTLQTVADQLAVAIENAHLLENAEARARQQRLLNEISTQMYRSTDVTEIIRTGLRALSKQLNGASVSIYLGDTVSESTGEPR